MSDNQTIKFYFGCQERAFTFDKGENSWKSADGYVAKKFYGYDTIMVHDDQGAVVARDIPADLTKVGSIYIEEDTKKVHLFGKNGMDSVKKTLKDYRKGICSAAPAKTEPPAKETASGRKLTSVNTISLPFSEASTVPADKGVIVKFDSASKTITIDSYYYKKIGDTDKYEIHIVTGNEELTAATDLTKGDLKTISYSIIFNEQGKMISVKPQYSDKEFALISPLEILKDDQVAPLFKALERINAGSAKTVTDGLAQIAKNEQTPSKEKLVKALKGMVYSSLIASEQIAPLLSRLDAADRKKVEDGLKTIIFDRDQIPTIDKVVAAIKNLPSYKASVLKKFSLEILKDPQVAPFFKALNEIDPASAKIVTDGLTTIAQRGQKPAKDKLIIALKGMVYKALLAHDKIVPLLLKLSEADKKLVGDGLKTIIYDRRQVPAIDKVVLAIKKLQSYKAAVAAPTTTATGSSATPAAVAPVPAPIPAQLSPEPADPVAQSSNYKKRYKKSTHSAKVLEKHFGMILNNNFADAISDRDLRASNEALSIAETVFADWENHAKVIEGAPEATYATLGYDVQAIRIKMQGGLKGARAAMTKLNKDLAPAGFPSLIKFNPFASVADLIPPEVVSIAARNGNLSGVAFTMRKPKNMAESLSSHIKKAQKMVRDDGKIPSNYKLLFVVLKSNPQNENLAPMRDKLKGALTHAISANPATNDDDLFSLLYMSLYELNVDEGTATLSKPKFDESVTFIMVPSSFDETQYSGKLFKQILTKHEIYLDMEGGSLQ